MDSTDWITDIVHLTLQRITYGRIRGTELDLLPLVLFCCSTRVWYILCTVKPLTHINFASGIFA